MLSARRGAVGVCHRIVDQAVIKMRGPRALRRPSDRTDCVSLGRSPPIIRAVMPMLTFRAEVVLMALHRGLLYWFCSSLGVCQKYSGGIMVSSLSAVMLLATPSISVAAQVNMGNVTINLPLPAGHCELMESNVSDKRMLTLNRD